MEAQVSELRLYCMTTSSVMRKKQYRKKVESAEVVEDLAEVLVPVLLVRQRYCRHRDAVVVHCGEHVHCDEVRQQRLPEIGQSSFEEVLDSNFSPFGAIWCAKNEFSGPSACC